MVNEVVGKSAYRYRNHDAPFARRQKKCQLRRTTAHAKRLPHQYLLIFDHSHHRLMLGRYKGRCGYGRDACAGLKS
jgi:hypothetical protein